MLCCLVCANDFYWNSASSFRLQKSINVILFSTLILSLIIIFPSVPSVSRLNNWAQRRVRVKKLPMPPIGGEIILYEEGSTKCELAELSDSALNVPKVEPLRILIIEDSITIIMIVTKLLEKKGHIVESAKNGFSGLNRLKEVFNTRSDFDLVLLDVQMPVLDGFECVSRYRAFEVEQIKNLNNSSISKSKTDNVKLLLHSNYFRVNYANSITTGNCNMDNFKYLESNSESARKIPLIRLANVPDNYNADDRQEEKAEHRGSPSIPDKALDDQPIVRGGKGTDIVLRRGNMAIVGMSANNDNESRILALRRGMNFFITKPFSASDLQNILNLFDN